MGLFSFIRRLFAQPPRELAEAHRLAWANFTYVADPMETKGYDVHDISKPFEDDCDGWASSVAAVLPGAECIEFWSTEYHAACLYKGWVSDNQYASPYKLPRGLEIKRRMAVTKRK